MGILDRIRKVREQNKNKERVFNVTEKKTSQKTQTETKKKVYGNIGRLEIPELNISVPVYDTKTGSAKSIIDAKNSAVYLRWFTQHAIADHSDHANFSNLNRVRVGHTVLYIDNGMTQKKYVCVKSQVGHIKIDGPMGNEIYDANWELAYSQNQGGLCLYTCMTRSAPNIMDVRLTYWQPVK